MTRKQPYFEDNVAILNPNVTLDIVGSGVGCDDNLEIVYTDNHVFEIKFDPKRVSVVLKADQTSIRERECHTPTEAQR